MTPLAVTCSISWTLAGGAAAAAAMPAGKFCEAESGDVTPLPSSEKPPELCETEEQD